jgi:tetratricopeptide (TPR) repeat protein
MLKNPSKLSWLLVPCLVIPLHARAQAGGEEQAARLADEGQQAMAAGQIDTARADFEQLAKLEPGIAEVHATLGAIYFQTHDYEQAVREVRTAQRLKPSLAKLDSLLGLSLAEMSRFSDALPHLEKGFKQTGDPDVRRMCGLQLLRAYTGLSRDSDAVETALEMNRLYPDDPEVLYHTGRIYGNYAYIVMAKLHDNAPDSVWMVQASGEANEAQKSYDAAIVDFNHVLEIDPQRPGIHYRLGRIDLERFNETHKQEDRDSAVREFMSEVSSNPGNGNARYELAKMQADQGNLEEARKQFSELLEHFPDFEEALVGLGGVDLDSQHPDAAEGPLKHATEVRPDDEVAWYRLAQAERQLGHSQEQRQALAAFQKLHAVSAAKKNAAAPLRSQDHVTPQQLGAGDQPQ